MSQPRDPKYSWVFQRLTENDQGFNLESMVAYTIYKKQKIDFINQIKTLHSGRDPNIQEWKTFHMQCELDSSLQGYRQQAAVVVSNLLNVALSAEIEALEEQALLESIVNTKLSVVETKLDTIDGYINEKKGLSWWFSQVTQNFSVNIATIVFVGGLATFVINFEKISDWFKKLVN